MEPKTRRMIEFVTARIDEDVQIAAAAYPGFNVEVTAHMTSMDHAAFVRRFAPDWVHAELLTKAMILKAEMSHAETVEEVTGERFAFPHSRLIAAGWRNHPDFDEEWLAL